MYLAICCAILRFHYNFCAVKKLTGSFAGAPLIDFSQIEIPGTSSTELSGLAAAAAGAQSPEDPKVLRDMILSSPHDLAMLKERNPPLADALLSGSLGW